MSRQRRQGLFDEWGEMLEIGSSDVCEKKTFAVLHYVICMLDNKRNLKILRQKPVHDVKRFP